MYFRRVSGQCANGDERANDHDGPSRDPDHCTRSTGEGRDVVGMVRCRRIQLRLQLVATMPSHDHGRFGCLLLSESDDGTGATSTAPSSSATVGNPGFGTRGVGTSAFSNAVLI